MAKSIIQKHTNAESRECFLCREEADQIGYYGELRHTGLHKHHFVYGRLGAYRKKAEQYGLWGYVCEERHHEYGPESPHQNAEVSLYLKQVAQEAFEKIYGHEKWMQEFGRNYLEDGTEAAGLEMEDEHEKYIDGFK